AGTGDEEVSAAGGTFFDSHINVITQVGSGLGLQSPRQAISQPIGSPQFERLPLATVGSGKTSVASYYGYGVSADIWYRIVDAGPTDFWLKAHMSSTGDYRNAASCEIFKGDPATGGQPTGMSVYTCDGSSGSGQYAAAYINLARSKVVE